MEEFQFSDDFPFQLADFLVNQPLIFQGVRYLHHENASGVINHQRWFKKNELCFESFFYIFFVGISYQPVCLIQSL